MPSSLLLEISMTEENTCFVILNYLNEHLYRHCKCPNERPFPVLRDGSEGRGGRGEAVSFKLGCSLHFSARKRGAQSKGAFNLGRGDLSENYSILKSFMKFFGIKFRE